LLPFLRDFSLRRRKGIVGVIKNCCFQKEKYDYLLSDEVDLVYHLLYPLRGSERLSADDMDGLHPSLHNNVIDMKKTREPDKDIRKTLIECLILLSGTKESRDILRKKQVYPMIREAEKPEEDTEIVDAMHKLVDLLMFTDDMPSLEQMMQKTAISPVKESKLKIEEVREEMEVDDVDDDIEEI